MSDPRLQPHFSEEHLSRKILYLKDQLTLLPKGSLITRKGHEYVRFRCDQDSESIREKRTNSPEARAVIAGIKRRQELQSQLDRALADWNLFYHGLPFPDIEPVCRALPVPDCMSLDYYENPPDIQNPYPPETPYEFEDMIFKSRFEIIAGQAMRELGLEFKYELPVITPNCTYFLDMVCPVPERGRAVGFEFAGRADSPKYMTSLQGKVTDYHSVGLIPNHDVIFVFGGKTWLPPMREIKNAIIFGIENC